MLRAAVPASLAVEHIGSTAVPGMAAKDCLDMMIVVDDLSHTAADQYFGTAEVPTTTRAVEQP